MIAFLKRNPWMWIVLFLGLTMVVDVLFVIFAIRTAPPTL